MTVIERSSIQLFHACSGAILVLILVQVTSFMVRGDDDEKWTTLQPEFRGAPKPPEFVRRLWGIYNLIPFPLVKIPEQILEIEYLDRIEVGTGRYLFARDLRSPPTRVAWPKQYVRSYYALIMTDLDYPTDKDNSQAEYLHWMIGNIEGPPERRRNNTIAQYIGPNPEEGTGVHRYVFFLFRQPKKIEYHYEPKLNTLRNDSRRCKFATRRFARRYNLGQPVAATFLLAQFWHYNGTS